MIRVNRRQVLVATGAIAAAPRLLGTELAGLRVVRPRTECIDRPMGLEVTQPRFAWALDSSGRNVMQTAYRITVGSDPSALLSGKADLWDSGRVQSDRCFDIAYAGAMLHSGQRAWWRVEVWDNRHQTAVLPEPAWFEMGLLESGAWGTAQWLAVEGPEEIADRAAGLHWIWGGEALDPKAQKFRFRCSLPAAPQQAELLLAAKDHLEGVWVHGAPLELPPPNEIFWGTMLRFPVNLVAGSNVVCVEATADTTGFLPPDGGAVVALLKVTGADGRVTRFTTGPDWRSSNTDIAGWQKSDFNDSSWPHAVPSRANTKCEPWTPQPAMLLRREFDVSKPVTRARLYATALGAYEASLNGRRVGEAHLSPEISVASDHVFYQCYDVMGLLCRGGNVIGALVGDGWYASAFSWQSERYSLGDGPRRFLALLVLEYEDGSRATIATGPQWKALESAVRSSEIYNGEIYDARAESPGWDQPGFDAHGWAVCSVSKDPAVKLVAQIDPPIRQTLTLKPVRVGQPRPGVFVCDFGQNFSGWCPAACQRSRGHHGAVALRGDSEGLR